jgi:hypothetical protein
MQIIATAVRHVVNTCRQISAQVIVAVPTSICVAVVTQTVVPEKPVDAKQQASISQPLGATEPARAEEAAPSARPEPRLVAANVPFSPPLTITDDMGTPVSLIGTPLESDFDTAGVVTAEAPAQRPGLIGRLVGGIAGTASRLIHR